MIFANLVLINVMDHPLDVVMSEMDIMLWLGNRNPYFTQIDRLTNKATRKYESAKVTSPIEFLTRRSPNFILMPTILSKMV